MNKPSKEEVDKAIKFFTELPTFIEEFEIYEKTALSILTSYRDGELVEKNQWISVKDRLPVGECLMIGYQNAMIIGYYSEKDNCGDSDSEQVVGITHWQPLPTPPTEPSNETK